MIEQRELPREPAPGIVSRIYTFRLTANGPDSPYDPISIPIKVAGMTEPVIEPEHCMVSIVYRPPVRIVPERILVDVDEQTAFPRRRTLSLSRLDGLAMPVISAVETPADWIDANLIDDGTDNVEPRVQLTIDEPAGDLEETGLVIMFADKSISPLYVPIRLATARDP